MKLVHDPGGFFLSRALRIWLPFLAAYLVVFAFRLATQSDHALEDISGMIVFGVASHKNDALGVSWSLDIELQFYLLVPLLIYVLRATWWTAFRNPIVAVFLVAPPVLGWLLIDTFAIVTALAYFPCFLLGTLIWVSKYRASRITAAVSVIFFVCVGIVVLILPATQTFLLKDIETLRYKDWFGILWTFALTPFIAWNAHQPARRLDNHFGNYSYSLYLVHFAFLDNFAELVGIMHGKTKLAGVICAIIVSAAFYFAVDRPFDSLRKALLRVYKKVYCKTNFSKP